MDLFVVALTCLLLNITSAGQSISVDDSVVPSVGDPQLDCLISKMLAPSQDQLLAVNGFVIVNEVALHNSAVGSYNLVCNSAERGCKRPLFGGAKRTENDRTDSTYCVLVYARICEYLCSANLILIMSPDRPIRHLSGVAYRCGVDDEYKYSIGVTHID